MLNIAFGAERVYRLYWSSVYLDQSDLVLDRFTKANGTFCPCTSSNEKNWILYKITSTLKHVCSVMDFNRQLMYLSYRITTSLPDSIVSLGFSYFPYGTIRLRFKTLRTEWRLFFVYHFPHIDAFWGLCSRRLFENMVTKEEIAQNEQFLLWSPCFYLYLIIVHSFKESFQIHLKRVSKLIGYDLKSSAADLWYVGKGFKNSHFRRIDAF